LKTIVLLGIYAGLRINAEALTLKVENVDIREGSSRSRAASSKNRDMQTIPLHKLAAPLQHRIQERGGLVFETREGKPIRSVRSAFTNACERANLSGVTPYTWRHTFASRLGMANKLTLQELGRWEEPKMILRRHLSTWKTRSRKLALIPLS